MNGNKGLILKILTAFCVISAIIFFIFIYTDTSLFSGVNMEELAKINNHSVKVNPEISEPIVTRSGLTEPVDKFAKRVSKKPFGIYVSSDDSPIMPEKFQGYHTGADAEIFADEDSKNIFVKAVADGTAVSVRPAVGYGGLVIIQHEIAGKKVYGVYGHIKLSSVIIKPNDKIKAGDIIGILGAAYSVDTGGERKHLHFGLYAGDTADIRGYVQTQEDLLNWLNPLQFF